MKNVLQMLEDETHIPEIWVTKFDEEHAQKFRKQLLEVAKSDPERPIVIYIDSYGGYVDALAKMIETIDEVPNTIITSCMGKAMSCGAILLAHGDIRFLGQNSRIMVHEISSGTIGNVQDMKEDVKETIRLNEHFMGLLARDCGFKNYEEFRAVIKEQDGRDRYLIGDDALKFGIVDAIGLPKVSGRILYEVSKQPQKAPVKDRNKQSLKLKKSPGRKNTAAAKGTKKSDTRKRK